MLSKLQTYIGFAIKSGKFKAGFNNAENLKKASLILICNTLTENGIKSAKKLSQKLNCPLYITVDMPLEKIILKNGVKLIAILDGNLAKAIIDNIENIFIEK